MKRFLEGIYRDNKGFTLIELLIVIAIIAVLSAVVLPNVTGLIGYGQLEAANAEAVTVQTAVDVYSAKTGTIPANTAALVSDYLRSAPLGTYTINQTTGVITGTAPPYTGLTWSNGKWIGS